MVSKNDLTGIVTLCLQNDVDVEVFYGVNSDDEKCAGAIITLDEQVVLKFSNKNEGYIVTSIELVYNKTIPVTYDELIYAITHNKVTKKWTDGLILSENVAVRCLRPVLSSTIKMFEVQGQIAEEISPMVKLNGDKYRKFDLHMIEMYEPYIEHKINFVNLVVLIPINVGLPEISVSDNVKLVGNYVLNVGFKVSELYITH